MKYGIYILAASTVFLSCIWYMDASKTSVNEADPGQPLQSVEVTIDETESEYVQVRKTEELAAITFDVPAEWKGETKPDEKFDEIYYYPMPVGQEYSHYIDLFYVSLELSRSDAASTILEYYGNLTEEDESQISENTIIEISGEKAMQFSIHYDDKEMTEYTTLIPVHADGLMVVTYALKDGCDPIYFIEYENILSSIYIPDNESIKAAYMEEIKREVNEEGEMTDSEG